MTGESERKRVMYEHSVRALLLAAPDGRLAGDLARDLGISSSYVNAILRNTYGCYVDRWTDVSSGSSAAVWMCVPVPENCPRPELGK